MRWLMTFGIVGGLVLAVAGWRLLALVRHHPPANQTSVATPARVASEEPVSARVGDGGERDSAPGAPAPVAGPPHDELGIELLISADSRGPEAGNHSLESPPPMRWAGQQQRIRAERRLADAREALTRDPYHPTALEDELSALRELGCWSEAADTLARLVELQPENTRRRMELVEALLRQHLWTTALRELGPILEREPENSRAWYYQAAAQQAAGRLADARRSWDRVTALEPDCADAYAYRGMLLLELQEWDAAATDLTTACALNPGDVGAALSRSVALARSGRAQEAQRCLLVVLERHPRDVRAMNRLAELAWQGYQSAPDGSRADLDHVIEWCRQSLAIDPQQPPIQSLLDAALRERPDE